MPSSIALRVAAPFHLEATVRLLARRPVNRVDSWADDRYWRVLDVDGDLHLIAVHNAGTLDAPALRVRWHHARPTAAQRQRVAATLRRLLGLDQPVSALEQLVRTEPTLAPLAMQLRGMRPPCFPTFLDEMQKALELYKQALSICRQVGYRQEEAETIDNIGLVYDALGERQKALKSYSQALLICRQIGYRKEEANVLNNTGLVYDALGQKQESLEFYSQALSIHRQVGDRSAEATALSFHKGVHAALHCSSKG